MTDPTRQANPGQATDVSYRIRVAGVLGEEWSGRAQGMTVSAHRSESGGSFTELIGVLPDQAALMGALDVLYTHRAPLLSVELINEDGSSVEIPELGVSQSMQHGKVY